MRISKLSGLGDITDFMPVDAATGTDPGTFQYGTVNLGPTLTDPLTGTQVSVSGTPPIDAVSTPNAQLQGNSWGWLSSIFPPLASVANTAITQNALTQRQQAAINAGQTPGMVSTGLLSTNAAGQSLIFGIPLTYVLIGGAAFLALK